MKIIRAIQKALEDLQKRPEDLINNSEENSVTFKRTKKEEELGLQFMFKNSEEIRKHVDNFESCRDRAFQTEDLNEKIELLKETLVQYEKSKKWFYKTKGGTIYFQDLYEHLYNSQNPDFSYDDNIRKHLNYYIQRRELIPQILQIISSHEEIMQKDIYQYLHLPDISKSEIQTVIRELESDNKISREKKGSSYILRLK